MANRPTPAEFRADASSSYQRLRARLIRLVIVAGGVGLLAGVLIGLAVGSGKTYLEAPPGGFCVIGGLIGLATGTVLAAAAAGVIWLAASLLYVMTQDGA